MLIPKLSLKVLVGIISMLSFEILKSELSILVKLEMQSIQNEIKVKLSYIS